MTPIPVLQHIDCETLGTIEGALNADNLPFRYVRGYAGEPVPGSIGDAPALIVMGGPMGVYEADHHPFLTDEMRLIESALKARRPVLGVCLGSQLLAHVLGARVRPGPRKEIGWHPVFFSSAAREDGVLAKTDEGFMFHWHGDIFDVPQGSATLASSDLTAVQAFRHGENAYGFLFHMEITEPMIRAWLGAFSAELEDAQIDPSDIIRGIPRYLPGLQAMGRRVFGNWVKTARNCADRIPAAETEGT